MRPEDKWPQQGKEEITPLLGLERIKARLLGHEDRDGEVEELKDRIAKLKEELRQLLSLCVTLCRDNETNCLIGKATDPPQAWLDLHSKITELEGWAANG